VPGNPIARADDAIEGHSGYGFQRSHVSRQPNARAGANQAVLRLASP
jgi:hypothetical protein